MRQGRDARDLLAAWAAERAPALLAQAEAAAVSELREALVCAAIARRAETAAPELARQPEMPARPQFPPAPDPPREQGELLWAYCVQRSSDPLPKGLTGVNERATVHREERAGLAALVSPVPRSEFASEPLQHNLNDMAWLARTARAHQAVLDAALEKCTIVPMRMCTLYESRDGVKRMLERQRDDLLNALELVEGRFEWAVKVTIDDDKLAEMARARIEPSTAVDQQSATLGAGSEYMQRRRLERTINQLADSIAAEVAEQIHARLQDWAIDGITLPPQNQDLSGHSGEMLLNGAYLVDRSQTDELRRIVTELEAHYGEFGVRISLTGPWPPYNFVQTGRGADLR